jgi:hypothetical protein
MTNPYRLRSGWYQRQCESMPAPKAALKAVGVGQGEERLGGDMPERVVDVARLEPAAIGPSHHPDTVRMARGEPVNLAAERGVGAVVEDVDGEARILLLHAGERALLDEVVAGRIEQGDRR